MGSPSATGASRDVPIRLDPRLPVAAIADVLRRRSRVHVPGIFETATAQRIHAALDRETPWSLTFNDAERTHTLAPEVLAAMPEARRAELEAAIRARAATEFQFAYKAFSMYDERAAGRFGDHYLMRLYEFLDSPPFLDLARRLTGVASITRADAQATLYEPGHFLTLHDDRNDAKKRVAAYVLNFTPTWRADWGGLLQFVDADGHVTEALTPTFNALNLFLVPQPHSVSYVAPFALGRRLSVTGWLRAD